VEARQLNEEQDEECGVQRESERERQRQHRGLQMPDAERRRRYIPSRRYLRYVCRYHRYEK